MTENEFATHWITVYAAFVGGASESQRVYISTLQKEASEVADKAIETLKTRLPKPNKKKELI